MYADSHLWYASAMRNFLTGRQLFVRVCLLSSVLLLLAVGVLTIYAVGNPVEPSPGLRRGHRENWPGTGRSSSCSSAWP